MTWVEMEGFAQYCINKGMINTELKNLANKMAHFDSVNFVIILAKKGIKISI